MFMIWFYLVVFLTPIVSIVAMLLYKKHLWAAPFIAFALSLFIVFLSILFMQNLDFFTEEDQAMMWFCTFISLIATSLLTNIAYGVRHLVRFIVDKMKLKL